MEWQQLEYFEATARLQHMTLASQELNITQPALSRSIAKLETELGAPLFERRGRSIQLNRYGMLFLEHVQRILEEYQSGKQEIEDLLNPEHGEVSLGFLHTLGIQQIPNLIGRFRAKNPSVSFQLHQNNTYYILNHLLAGEIDLCLVSHPQDWNHNVEWVRLCSEELFLVVPAGHRLAGRDSIPLKEIANERLISFKEGYGLRKIINHLLVKSEINPTILFEGEDVHTIAGLVAAGLGVSILPKSKGLEMEGLAWVTVSEPVCRRDIGIARVAGRYLSPAAEQFRDFVIKYFGESEN